MTELSDYRRIVEKPQMDALNARIEALQDEVEAKQVECNEAWARVIDAEAKAESYRKALERSHKGWANAIEFGIIPPQHQTSAKILRDEAAQALAGRR